MINGHKYFTSIVFILLLFLAAGCSDKATPESLEPLIELSEATDITRSEAILTGSITLRGSAHPSYVTLVYRAADTTEIKTVEGDPDKEKFTFLLTELTAGTSYECYLEVGTATARLESNTVCFTTVSYDLPSVATPTPLSTGPLGIIVKFRLLDDGGTRITGAGCEVRRAGASDSNIFHALYEPDEERYYVINITGLSPQTTYTITPFASNLEGEAYGQPLEYTTTNGIILHEPGVFRLLFGEGGDTEIDALTIAGEMNGDDFHYLRILAGAPSEITPPIYISDLNLTDVSIVEGGESYDSQHFTVNDHLTTGLLAGCSTLRNILLPNSVTVIERDALAHCLKLETLAISANVQKLLPSADCPDLRDIQVSGANRYFKSDQGVLLNMDGSEILWFPCGKKGDYTLPSTITGIGENAFAGTSITALIVPPTVKNISRGAFAGSSLREITLPDNLTNISEGMFQNCHDLTTVYLGTETTYIGNFVFDGTSIKDIFLSADYPPFTMEDTFMNGDSTIFNECTLHVPVGCKIIYRNHTKWGLFSNIEEYQP